MLLQSSAQQLRSSKIPISSSVSFLYSMFVGLLDYWFVGLLVGWLRLCGYRYDYFMRNNQQTSPPTHQQTIHSSTG
jgi:hypothetical protein